MKITICGKGGCGKITVTSLLAKEFARMGKTVLVGIPMNLTSACIVSWEWSCHGTLPSISAAKTKHSRK